jgi:hypothetical protein
MVYGGGSSEATENWHFCLCGIVGIYVIITWGLFNFGSQKVGNCEGRRKVNGGRVKRGKRMREWE